MKRIIYILMLLLLPNFVMAQFADDPAEPGNKYKLSVVASPTDAGRVYGGGSYSKGTKVEVYTYANDGYTFTCWKKGDEVVSTSSSFYYIMPNSNTTLTAYFTKNGNDDSGTFNPQDPSEPNSPGSGIVDDAETYTLTILKDPEKGGKINKEGEYRMKKGETVYLYATPSNGYEMDGWYINGKLLSIQESYSYTMWNKNDTIVARFMYKPSDPSEPGHSENKEFIVISSQSDLEQYANVEEFPRSVRINGTAITSLHSLSKMKKINGDLRIENTSLVNLEGLDNLTNITGKLIVSGNRLLVSMDGIYSWDGIYYVLIEDNPELVDYCAMTAYAQKASPAGVIHDNAYNPTFEQISDGNCSKNEDVFKVTETNFIREPNQIHVNVRFSNEPLNYSSLKEFVSFYSNAEALTLNSFSKNNLSYDLYFSSPKKEGEYTLIVHNTLGDVKGHDLNQNGNFVYGEDDDNYRETICFGGEELYVVAQSPLTGGALGEPSYTELVFSDYIENFPISTISLVAPSGNSVEINSISYVDNVSPSRYRVNYGALNEDGVYSFSLTPGLTSKSGKTMIYAYHSTIEMPSANFVPQSIEPTESNWVSGTTQSIKYVVKNTGTKRVTGKCVDVIYLSSTDTWNTEAIELYRDTVSVNVDSNESYSQNITVNVPTVVDGKYYFILKTNVTHVINELTYNDNTLSSDGPNVSVEVLSDENKSFSLKRGESKIFRILVESDKNVEIIDKSGIANMYLGYYQLPSLNDSPNRGSVTLLGTDASTKYYLLVSNNGKSNVSNQKCDIELRTFDLEIGSIERTSVIKHGTAWIPITVNGCTAEPVFYLMDENGQKNQSLNVIVKTNTRFYAQFDTETLKSGQYSLYVESNGMTGIKQKAITITDGQAQTGVISKLVLPETSRIGSTITAYIDYYNSGNVDLPAPLFILTGTEGSSYELPSGGIFTSEAHIIGINENGVMSTLIPGESNRISVNITIPNERITTANYKLKTITEGCDGIEQPFYLQWLDVDPNEKPTCYTDDQWNEYCNRLRKNVGNTWGSFIHALGMYADYFYSNENYNYDANCLYNLIKDIELTETNNVPNYSKSQNTRGILGIGEVEPGTIYIWDIWDTQWKPLVEAVYDTVQVVWKEGINEQYNFREWKRTENCAKLTSSKYFFISHGMNNNHNQDWIREMAIALSSKGTVITVDWGRWAKAGGLLPMVSAHYISQVSARVHDALNVAFNNYANKQVNLNQFHLIGHSHGAHVCGRLANLYNIRAKRITALDASEEISHMSGSQLGTKWNASFIDYYKSSVTCGTEYLAGHDNFILASGNSKFTLPGLNIGEDIIFRHGYACTWFTQSIYSKDEVGFNWYENRHKHPKVTDHIGWSGVINGPDRKIDNYSKYCDIDGWKYTSPWYVAKGNNKKYSEWDFRTAISSTFDYVVNDSPMEYYGTDKYIHGGTTDWVKIKVKNNADNLTVPLDIRQRESSSKATHVLYVSKTNNNSKCQIQKDKDNLSSVSFNVDLHYLGARSYYIEPDKESSDAELNNVINFNFSSKLWKELDGPEDDYADFDFWLVSGVDKSSDYKTSYTRNVQLWKGELDPSDNCKKFTLKVKNPNLSCKAGNDRTIKLKKNETETNVNVSGTVERDNGNVLSYFWEKAKSVFSNAKEGNISLGVGKHRLTFRIKSEGNSTRAASSSENEAEDDVVITVEPYTPGDDDEESTSTASSWDPNEKVSIKGAGSKSCVKPEETMEYTIFFENDAEMAQLAAQTVTVIDTLDVAFDLSTFEFTGAKASNNTVDIPNGLSELCIYTDMRPNNDLILKTDMKLDTDNRIVTVVYSSLDTLTNEPTQDVFAGFLPPNDSTHVGEGCFSYRVKLKENVPDGYDVKNQAHIFFDYNDEIATNITSNYVDNALPKSYVEKLPLTTSKDSILVKWTGQDEGAGIKYYDVYCSKNGDSYYLWKEKSTENSSYIKGEIGDKYEFFSIATDSLNYVEEFKKIAEATIEFVAPQPVPNPIASLDSGTEVYRGTKVQFDVEGENMKIWYTLDGSSPLDENGTKQLYLNPIRIDKNISIRAVAENEDGMFSEVVAYDYYIMQSKAGVLLNEGWSWISFNMKNDALSGVNTAFASGEWTSDDIVKNNKYVDMYSANQKQWIGTLSKHGAFNNAQMYKIHSSKSQTLGLTGEAVHPSETTITVVSGWNYISYLPLVNMNVSDALKGYKAENGDVIKSQDAFATYSTANGWEGDLTMMTVGRGYMLKRGVNASQVSFTYPVESFGSSVKAAAPAKSYRYADNMNIIGEVEGINVEDGDSLVAYVNGEIRGASRLERNHKVFLTIQGDEDAKMAIVLVRDGEIIATASNMIGYKSNNVLGTSDAPTAITFVTDDSRLDGNVGNVKAIYGINGIKMNTRRLNNIPSGTYIIYSEKNGNTCVTKFIK